MSETANVPRRPWVVYLITVVVMASVTALVLALILNIAERKREAKETFVKLVEMDEDTIDPEVWRQNFPREYDGYIRTAENTNRRHGGSEAVSRLEEDPRLRRIFAGYAFSVDFRERRGHAFMLEDQDKTERVTKFKQPGACLHCHSSIIPAYRKAGDGDVMKGFEKVCGMPLAEARKLVGHPVSCIDCHDPKTIQLRVTRPGFLNGIKALARSNDPLPHLPSIEGWRKGKREADYDPNTMATRQEMRSFVCGQCHVEYYFRPEGKVVTYPWNKGLKVEQIEAYYDEIGFTDFKHGETGASVLKAQHPEFEMWSQGIHARSGVSCADCHMPYKREGAVKVSDHQVRSPLLMISRVSDVPPLPGEGTSCSGRGHPGPDEGAHGSRRGRRDPTVRHPRGGPEEWSARREAERVPGSPPQGAVAARFRQRRELAGFSRLAGGRPHPRRGDRFRSPGADQRAEAEATVGDGFHWAGEDATPRNGIQRKMDTR